MGERLKIETEIEDKALICKMPAFSVQPIIENAIKHAVAPNKNGGRIKIFARVLNGKLNVEIADDGTGASLEKIESSEGLGMRLVRESLAARFGSEAEFDYKIGADKGFTVSIIIPQTADGNGKLQ